MKIQPSTRKGKRFMVTFSNGVTTHFGMAGAKTYIDEGDKAKREAYLKRHRARENWDDPYSAGALSRFLNWNKPTLKESMADFMKRFPNV